MLYIPETVLKAFYTCKKLHMELLVNTLFKEDSLRNEKVYFLRQGREKAEAPKAGSFVTATSSFLVLLFFTSVTFQKYTMICVGGRCVCIYAILIVCRPIK